MHIIKSEEMHSKQCPLIQHSTTFRMSHCSYISFESSKDEDVSQFITFFNGLSQIYLAYLYNTDQSHLRIYTLAISRNITI